MVAADSGLPSRELPQEDRGPGGVLSAVPSFLDNLLGSIFGGGSRNAQPAPAPNSAERAQPSNRGSSVGSAGSRPSGGGTRPPAADRNTWRD
jgi:hypothetical protein